MTAPRTQLLERVLVRASHLATYTVMAAGVLVYGHALESHPEPNRLLGVAGVAIVVAAIGARGVLDYWERRR